MTANLSSSGGNTGEAAGDTYNSVENIIGSSQGDTLTGDGSANVLTGGLGDDTLTGGGGADNLFGGDNDDVLVGGSGGDDLDGGSGTDTASYVSSSAGINITVGSGTGSGGDAAGDTLTNIETVLGSSHGDVIDASSTAVRLEGNAGNDTLTGSAQADTLLVAPMMTRCKAVQVPTRWTAVLATTTRSPMPVTAAR